MDLGKVEACRLLTRKPGTAAAIPGSLWIARLYPKLLHLEGPQGQSVVYDLPIAGVVVEWSAQVDYLRQEICIWGRANDAFRLKLSAGPEGITLQPKGTDRIIIIPEPQPAKMPPERLQFGAHDTVIIEHWAAKPQLARLLQMWHALGCSIDSEPVAIDEVSLLGKLALAVSNQERHQLAGLFTDIWRTGFCDMWAPRKVDASFWGYTLPATQSPAYTLLCAGAALIRQLIVSSSATGLSLLPLLPKELPAGRLLHGQGEGYSFHLEWTKGAPRRLLLQSHSDCTLQLHWPQMQQARLRNLSDKQPALQLIMPGETLHLTAHQSLLIDHFQKSRRNT